MLLNNINFILAQVVGLAILITNIINDLQTKRDNFIIYNTLINFLCVLQYLLLGAYTGIICCLIAIIRNFIFGKFKTKVPLYIFIIYIIITLIANIFFINNFIDIIPIFNIIIFSLVLRFDNIKNIKICLIITGFFGSIYDIYQKAYTGLFLNITDFVVGIIETIKLNKNMIKYK